MWDVCMHENGKSELRNGGNAEISKSIRMSVNRCFKKLVPKEQHQNHDAE